MDKELKTSCATCKHSVTKDDRSCKFLDRYFKKPLGGVPRKDTCIGLDKWEEIDGNKD